MNIVNGLPTLSKTTCVEAKSKILKEKQGFFLLQNERYK